MPARESLQERGDAPCCARTELCAERYASMSEPEADPFESEFEFELLLLEFEFDCPELEFWF